MSKKNKNLKIISLILSFIMGITGTIYIYTYFKKTRLLKSPYNGSQMNFNSSSSADFEVRLHDNEDDLNKKINAIRNNKGDNKKISYILYSNILENPSLLESEKKTLENFCQYFLDNRYLDHENVCRKLSSFIINENDETLLEENIGATYYDDNSITFATQADRDNSLAHELFHCIENKELSYEEYAWLIEGYTCVLNYEYFDNDFDGNNMKANFVRALCEIVNPNVLFEVSAKGNINYLVEALKEKGISEKDINELFDLCKNYNYVDSFSYEDTKEICVNIADCLVKMYNTAYSESNSVSNLFYNNLERIIDPNITTPYNYYYFNGSKKQQNKQKKYTVSKDALYAFKRSDKILS